MTGGKGKQRRAYSSPNRRVVVQGVRRTEVDRRKAALGFLALVSQARAEAEAQADHESRKNRELPHAS